DRALPNGGVWAVMSNAAKPAPTCASLTTPAATGTARSARLPLPRSGSPIATPNCCPCPISTSSSPCRGRSPTSPITTRRSSMTCCSKPPRDPDHDCGRPQAPRRPHRAHCRAPHLGIGTDPPSPCPYHRTRWRLLARWPTLDCLPTRLLPVRPGALTPLPPSVPGKADRHLPCRALEALG